MPRLSTSHYLRTHHSLRLVWLTDQTRFRLLQPSDQQSLHSYFQPANDWSDAQLLAHRKQITKTQPSLPQQAGRALSQLEQLYAAATTAATEPRPPAPRRLGSGRERHITVHSVLRPEPDTKKLLYALLQLARENVRKARELEEATRLDPDRVDEQGSDDSPHRSRP